MRFLLILFLHPTYIIRVRGPVPLPLLILTVAGSLAVCGISFSYLFPRLLNSVPWLGLFRKFHPGTWHPRFDPELFARGVAMGLVVFVSYTVIFGLFLLVKGRFAASQAILFALAACIPLFITCVAGFLLFNLYPSLGLAPVYGLFASAGLQVIFLRDLCSLHRALVIYVAPAVTAAQLYGCYLLLP